MRVSAISVLAALVAGALLSGGATARPAKEPRLPGGWSHAEINVTIRGVPHTRIYDRGTITAISSSSITLDEPDGSIVTIELTRTTKVTVSGKRADVSKLRVGYTATTLRIDGGAAVQVDAVASRRAEPTSKPSTKQTRAAERSEKREKREKQDRSKRDRSKLERERR